MNRTLTATVGLLAMAIASQAHAASIFSSVLPGSRTVEVGQTFSINASISKAPGIALQKCFIIGGALAFSPQSVIARFELAEQDPNVGNSFTFDYQAVNAQGNAIVAKNTAVDMSASQTVQNFIITMKGNFPTNGEYKLKYSCEDNSSRITAPVFQGINTFRVNAYSKQGPAKADVIPILASQTGIAEVPRGGFGAFALSAINLGGATNLRVQARLTNSSLPVTIFQCQTDINRGAACNNPSTPTTSPVITRINANETITMSFFVTTTANIPLDPARNRIEVQMFGDNGFSTTTSIAIQTR